MHVNCLQFVFAALMEERTRAEDSASWCLLAAGTQAAVAHLPPICPPWLPSDWAVRREWLFLPTLLLSLSLSVPLESTAVAFPPSVGASNPGQMVGGETNTPTNHFTSPKAPQHPHLRSAGYRKRRQKWGDYWMGTTAACARVMTSKREAWVGGWGPVQTPCLVYHSAPCTPDLVGTCWGLCTAVNPPQQV